jgi:hypothetical protein
MKLTRSDLPLAVIVRRISEGSLDLQPDFLRGEIWDRRRQQRLIDTILRAWYVPAVYVVEDEDGGGVVLDGQQRLAAIRDFFADKFTVDGLIGPPSGEIDDLDGLKFSQLPEAVRRSLLQFPLQVVSLTEFKPQEPNELFLRLNQSYNLTASEMRNALHGPSRDRVKDVVARLVKIGLLNREVIGFANGRLAYDDVISRTCVALEINTLRGRITNDAVEEFYRNDYRSFSERTTERVERAGRELLAQIRRGPGKVHFNKGTLFTWLVYLAWAPHASVSVPETLLASFESDRLSLRSRGYDQERVRESRTLECLALYEDRASYRVTDVNSILVRDLMVHLYSCLRFTPQPYADVYRLIDELDLLAHTSMQRLVADFLDTSSWGSDLGGLDA